MRIYKQWQGSEGFGTVSVKILSITLGWIIIWLRNNLLNTYWLAIFILTNISTPRQCQMLCMAMFHSRGGWISNSGQIIHILQHRICPIEIRIITLSVVGLYWALPNCFSCSLPMGFAVSDTEPASATWGSSYHTWIRLFNLVDCTQSDWAVMGPPASSFS